MRKITDRNCNARIARRDRSACSGSASDGACKLQELDDEYQNPAWANTGDLHNRRERRRVTVLHIRHRSEHISLTGVDFTALRLFGIETEYGISVSGRGAGDLIQESIALVRSYEGPHVTGWNYRGEDPRRDMRGFTVEHLSTDPDDAQFDAPGTPPMSSGGRAQRPDSREWRAAVQRSRAPGVQHAGVLEPARSGGARQGGRADRLGVAQAHSRKFGLETRIYKNNTDYHGASYGTHECYLMRRDVPAEALIRSLVPFLVTRQIYAGCGKVGVEVDRVNRPVFQLSQRADFFNVEASVDTLHNRPLVNTRDEPHATPRILPTAACDRRRREHERVGDGLQGGRDVSSYLALLEQGWTPIWQFSEPVRTLKALSRDQSLRWIVTTEEGKTISAVDVQRLYLEEAKRRLSGLSEEMDWTLAEWSTVLDALECDLMSAADRVDWIAKRRLLDEYMEAEGLDWDDPQMQSLDLAYHDVDPEAGLYHGLDRQARCGGW